jgi:hypothetical protein
MQIQRDKHLNKQGEHKNFRSNFKKKEFQKLDSRSLLLLPKDDTSNRMNSSCALLGGRLRMTGKILSRAALRLQSMKSLPYQVSSLSMQ